MKKRITKRIEYLEKIRNNKLPLFFILGPCVIESEKHSLAIAEFLTTLSEKLNFHFVFKSSFDKANRSTLKNFRGIGIIEGLNILNKIKHTFEIPIITDIHEPQQADVIAEVADIIQIPAFLCRQTDLLLAAGNTGKIIHLKKGQFIAPENMQSMAEKLKSTKNNKVWLCERGYTFGYNNLIVDYRNFPIMKQFEYPITFDATHSVQRPGGHGSSTGGNREFVPNLAAAAIVQGIAGIFLEVHDQPEKARCDGPNSIRLSQLENLLSYFIELDQRIKENPLPEIN